MVAPLFPLWAWLVFGGLVLALLILDLFVLHRNAREVPFKEAIWLSVFGIAVSLAFGGFVWFLAGVEGFEAYLAAYLLEKSLSLDNVFVFSVIFTSFAVPERDRYHVLFYGVIGAIVFRAIFVLAGTAILVFVGAKFVAQGFGLQIPILASLLVIAAAIIVTIVASLIATRGGKHGEGGTGLGSSTHETDGRKRG
jgi:hypothetical protein